MVLTHGAGADCTAPLLVAVATAFCAAGITVLRCDLAFRQDRPRGPPSRGSAENDRAGLRLAVQELRRHSGGAVIVGGHSYGGRQASMLAAEAPGLADGLLLLSYPLHPPQKPERRRTGHFGQLRTAAVFVHGTRDSFGTLEEMRDALRAIPAPTTLVPIDGAGHDLKGGRFDLAPVIEAVLRCVSEHSARG